MTNKLECMYIAYDWQAYGLLVLNALFTLIYLVVIGFALYNIITFLKG